MICAPALLAAAWLLIPSVGSSGIGGEHAAETTSVATPEVDPDEPAVGMPWQRSLEDALALSRATGKPVLICVNMDGESASDSMARGRYRDPSFLALVDGFVPILASPVRHGPIDYTASGRRVPDPRFGRLVESEHIDHEPRLFERYFDGTRVAPRHVGVAPDGRILFDLYLLRDLGVIDGTLRKHGVFDVPTVDYTTLDEALLLASPDATARELIEARFHRGDAEERIRLAQLAFAEGRTTQHPELVRMALSDGDRAVRLAGARIVAAHPVVGADFLVRAFTVADGDPRLRAELAGTALALADSADPEVAKRGKRLAGILAGLASPSRLIDVGVWRAALVMLGESKSERPGIDELSRELSEIERTIDERADDLELRRALAEGALELAELYLAEGGGNPTFALQDARDAAEAVLASGPDPVASALLARAAYLAGDLEAAGVAAAEALPGLIPLASSRTAQGALDALVQVYVRSIYAALAADEEVSPREIADAVAAYRVLVDHPLASAEEVVACLEFFDAIEAYAEQTEVCRRVITRFPGTGGVHIWSRSCVLRDEGVEELSVLYDELEAPAGWGPAFHWFSGLAKMVAAETLGRDGRPDASIAMFRTSIESFERSMEAEPDFSGSASHYVVLARGGLARIRLEEGAYDEAMAELRTAASLVPSSFAEKDSLGRMPRQLVEELTRALRRGGRADEARSFEAELKEAGVRL